METLIRIMKMLDSLELEAQKLERRIKELEEFLNHSGMFTS